MPSAVSRHGTFVPLVVMYPLADVPVVQLSLRVGYDPSEHLAIGRALAPLRDQGVLIVGSGLSHHNLHRVGPPAALPSRQFDDWLQQTLIASDPQQRVQRLIEWQDAPAARVAHPQEDHLLPLMVVVGAAERDAAICVYHKEGFFGSITVSSFRFGLAAASRPSVRTQRAAGRATISWNWASAMCTNYRGLDPTVALSCRRPGSVSRSMSSRCS